MLSQLINIEDLNVQSNSNQKDDLDPLKLSYCKRKHEYSKVTRILTCAHLKILVISYIIEENMEKSNQAVNLVKTTI